MYSCASKQPGRLYETACFSTAVRRNNSQIKFRWVLSGIIAWMLASWLTAYAAVPGDTATVTLAWNPSTDARVTGYRIYYGATPAQYTNSIVIGNVTTATVNNLVKGVTYYFATTARDASGVESTFSNEISYRADSSRLRLQLNPARQPVLTVEGTAGRSYIIEATQNFTTWANLITVTANTSGTASFVDTNAGSLNRRFYRLREVAP
jgi:fibronectin type 3 domain-containing protein